MEEEKKEEGKRKRERTNRQTETRAKLWNWCLENKFQLLLKIYARGVSIFAYLRNYLAWKAWHLPGDIGSINIAGMSTCHIAQSQTTTILELIGSQPTLIYNCSITCSIAIYIAFWVWIADLRELSKWCCFTVCQCSQMSCNSGTHHTNYW